MCRKRRRGGIAAGVAATVLLASTQLCAAEAPAASAVSFYIESQPLVKALNQWAIQAGLQVVWPAGNTEAYSNSTPVQGTLEPMEALSVLLEGTGLTFSVVSEGRTVAIRDREQSVRLRGTANRGGTNAGNPRFLRIASADDDQLRGGSFDSVGRESEAARRMTADKETGGSLLEVVVTGTHIRGIEIGASPAQVLTRADIDQSGLTTTEQVLRSLSANFSGGIGVETRSSGVLTQHGGDNRGYASSANLRGLGSDATLVLVNGQRLPVASEGYSADVSTIPVAIIERVEVLKDGASSIYGSDAVAGVINIITKRSFEGAQTSLVGSSVTSGHKQDYQVSQLVGNSWESGSALLNYSYDRREPLSSRSRSFARAAPETSTLFPESTAHSAYLAATQEITDALDVAFDAIWNHRRVRDEAAFDAGGFDDVSTQRSTADSLIGTLTATYRLGSGWNATVTGLAATDATDYESVRRSGTLSFDTRYRGRTYSVEPAMEGPIAAVPGGSVRGAIGGSYRTEKFQQAELYELDRRITAGYAEVFVPLYSRENARPGLQRLELTLSGRYEDYDDFGSTKNPKIGVLWSPVAGLGLRGSYSESFRAPLLAELQQGDAFNFLLDLPDPLSATGSSLALYRINGNPDLQPQTADNHTFGVVFDSQRWPGLRAELTYFDIRFKDRIQQPGDGAVLIETEPEIYGDFLTRNPSPAEVAALVDSPTFLNFFGDFVPADVALIADARRTNLSSLDVNGIDLAASYRAAGAFSFTLDASYLMDYEETLVAGQAPVVRRDTPYYPAALRVRAGANQEFGSWSVGGFVNYVGPYQDSRDPDARVDVSSWITFDAQVAYSSAMSASGPLADTKMSLSVINALDRDPPFVLGASTSNDTSFGKNFDPTNASALGRYVSLRIVKSW